MNKLEELIKESNAEVIYKGDLSTAIEVSEHVQKTIQGNSRCFWVIYDFKLINVTAVQASHNKPPLILNSTVAPNPQPYKLMVDSRLGVLVSSNTSNGTKQPKIQVCTLYCGFKFSVCLNATEACCVTGFIFLKVLWSYYWSHYLCFLWHLLNNLIVKLDTLFSWYYLMFNARSWASCFLTLFKKNEGGCLLKAHLCNDTSLFFGLGVLYKIYYAKPSLSEYATGSILILISLSILYLLSCVYNNAMYNMLFTNHFL